MDHVAAEIHHLKRLTTVADTDLPSTVAYLYDYVNFAHPFREGNGRAIREFFNLLLADHGNGLDWNQTDAPSCTAPAIRRVPMATGLTKMFAKILDTAPAYDF